MKSANKTQTLGTLLQQFFTHYLQEQRDVSQCTVASYRDTFRLLLGFTEKELGRRPAELALADLDAKLVLAFLEYLEKGRHNTARTRNSRLAGIRSFMHFVSLKEPQALAACEQVLAIPVKRYERPLIGYVSREEIKAILQAPDENTWSGQRDRVLFATMYNTGARVSELIRMRVSDLTISETTAIRIHGKGRKLRSVPIWKSTARQLKQWLAVSALANDQALFPNRKGAQLTRTGITDRLMLATRQAATNCLSLSEQRVTPHIVRHSTAMHLLQSGVDITIIALWLGHESPATTHSYIEADLAMKENAMKSLAPPDGSCSRFKPSDKLMKFLDTL
jgi:site-specific recombinase XerD